MDAACSRCSGDAGGDQPVSLLLQSTGDSGAAGDNLDAGHFERGGAAAENEAAGDGAIAVGVLFALAMLTKTNAVFLAPAVGWAMAVPLWERRKVALKCGLAAGLTAAVAYGAWIALIARAGLMGDYKYFFLSANSYVKPPEFSWPLAAFWWSLHGMLWVDHSLVLLAGALAVGAALAWRSGWGRRMLRDPVFGASILGILGFVLFMTVQNHPQPRYFTVPAFLVCIVVALGNGNAGGAGGVGAAVGMDCDCGSGDGGGHSWMENDRLRDASGVHVCECGDRADTVY